MRNLTEKEVSFIHGGGKDGGSFGVSKETIGGAIGGAIGGTFGGIPGAAVGTIMGLLLQMVAVVQEVLALRVFHGEPLMVAGQCGAVAAVLVPVVD